MSLETTAETSRQIAELREDRPSRRKSDYGGIAALAASMAVEGQRHPILVMPNGQVLKGGRRLAAARHLGWATIAARNVDTVEDAIEALSGSADELTRPRTLTEMVDLGMSIETLDRRPGAEIHDYAEYIGRVLTTSGAQYKRAKTVVLASRSQLRAMHVVAMAKRVLEQVDAGLLTVHAAYGRVKGAEKMPPPDEIADDGLPTLAPPSPQARSPKARMLREQWIHALAGQGATADQIAQKLGISISGVRHICKQIGVEIPAEKVLARTQRKAVDHNRTVSVALDDLDALVWSLDRVDTDAVDDTQREEWAKRLGRYARDINRVSRKIKRSKE